MNGPLPAPAGALPRFVPAFCTAAGERIIPERSVSVASRGENAFLRLNCTCVASTAVTDATVESSLRRGDEGVLRMRLILKTTASALNGVPSQKVTPLRSVKTSCVGVGVVQEVARSGTIWPCALSATSVSYMFSMTWRSTSADDLIGSSVTTSEFRPATRLPLFDEPLLVVFPFPLPPHAASVVMR